MEKQSLGSRIKHAWNAFRGNNNNERQADRISYVDIGTSSSYRPDMRRLTVGNERSIVTAIYNRISMDVSSLNFSHVQLDESGRYNYEIKSGLDDCLTLSPNIDQTSRAFFQDIVLSMFDEGCVAVVPVDTTFNPRVTGSYDILSMRTGKIVEWYPQHVRVSVYDEGCGVRKDVVLPKTAVAIIENPLYAVINGPQSTLKRLIRKLNLLDAIDEQSSSGKLDLIIQLPYVTHSQLRREQAEQRRKAIEDQLVNSKYGIAYADSTEKIVQLNRPVENNLLKSVEYLTSMLYSQLGITQAIMDGTADEKTMTNYYSRTIEPIAAAISDEMKRKFLTKNARTRMQSITFFRDPFKLVPVSSLAELADKFTRNAIMSPNEIRQIINMKKSEDPASDELKNRNISEAKENNAMDPNLVEEGDVQNA